MTEAICQRCGKLRPIFGPTAFGPFRCGKCHGEHALEADELLVQAADLVRGIAPARLGHATRALASQFLDRYDTHKGRQPETPTPDPPEVDAAILERFRPAAMRCVAYCMQAFNGYPISVDTVESIRCGALNWLAGNARGQGPWLVDVNADPRTGRIDIDIVPDFAQRLDRLGPVDAYDPHVDFYLLRRNDQTQPVGEPAYDPRADRARP